jgi:hypothetical protein
MSGAVTVMAIFLSLFFLAKVVVRIAAAITLVTSPALNGKRVFAELVPRPAVGATPCTWGSHGIS